jgi:hypothetical protein
MRADFRPDTGRDTSTSLLFDLSLAGYLEMCVSMRLR